MKTLLLLSLIFAISETKKVNIKQKLCLISAGNEHCMGMPTDMSSNKQVTKLSKHIRRPKSKLSTHRDAKFSKLSMDGIEAVEVPGGKKKLLFGGIALFIAAVIAGFGVGFGAHDLALPKVDLPSSSMNINSNCSATFDSSCAIIVNNINNNPAELSITNIDDNSPFRRVIPKMRNHVRAY